MSRRFLPVLMLVLCLDGPKLVASTESASGPPAGHDALQYFDSWGRFAVSEALQKLQRSAAEPELLPPWPRLDLRWATPPGSASPPAQGMAVVSLPVGPLSDAEVMQFFTTWGGYAVWENDVAEFSLAYQSPFGPRRQAFEVYRRNREFSLRRIPFLSRPLLDHGVLVLSPMHFTETQAMRDDYYRANPKAVPGQFVVPRGGPQPRPPRPPVRASPMYRSPPTPVTTSRVLTSAVVLDEVGTTYRKKYADYIVRVVRTVGNRWKQLRRTEKTHDYSVTLKFVLTSDGLVPNLAVLRTVGGESDLQFCDDAVMDGMPYEPWTEEMKSDLGESLDFTLTFHAGWRPPKKSSAAAPPR